MRVQELFQRNSVLTKYLLVLLAVLVVPTGLGVLLLSFSMDISVRQVEENSYKKLEQIQMSFDRDVENIRRIAVDMATNEELINFTYDETPQTRYQLSQLTQKLNKYYQEKNSLILNAFAYLKEYQFAIADNGKNTARELYERNFHFKDMSFADWNRFLSESYYNKLIPVREMEFQDGSGTKPVLAYLQSYPFGKENSKGNIVILLDYEKIAETTAGMYTENKSCMYLTDEEGNVVFKTGNDAFIQPGFRELPVGYSRQRLDGEDVLVFRRDSGIDKYHYVSVESVKSIKAQMNPLKWMLFGYVMLVLLAGGILLAVITYKGIVPVRKMLHSLQKSVSDGEEQPPGNELETISAGIERLVAEKNEVETIMEGQIPVMRKSLVARLISGNFGTMDEMEAACQAVDLSFPFQSFCVVLMVPELTGEGTERELPLVKYAITNIAAELFGQFGSIYCNDAEWSQVTGLINLEKKDGVYESILKSCDYLKRVIEDQLKAKLQIGVGGIHSGMDQASLSYSEAREAMEYKTLSGNDHVMPYRDVSGKEFKYHYSIEQENRLINAVMQGDEQLADKMLDQIVQRNSGVSLELSRCLFFDLMSTALKVINNKELDLEAVFDGGPPFARLADCKTIVELKDATSGILHEICGFIRQSKSGKKENLKNAILRYIDSNCENPGLSLDTVADSFGLNYTYVSHFFKDYIGENFTNYVTRRKVERAKRYLKTTPDSVADIASRLGYANSAVLIRNFKKITGMTPGQYRDLPGKDA